MTTFEPTATAAPAPSLHPQAVLTVAVAHALRRDLGRLGQVLGEPITAVRRAALIGHVEFLLGQLQVHHQLQDESIWPAAVTQVPDLVDLREQVRRGHFALGEPIGELRNAARVWQRSAATRPAMRSAVQDLTSAVTPVLELDSEMLPIACTAVPPVEWSAVDRRAPRLEPPTRVARRTFWLLDELDPATASLLLARRPRAAMWVLRNGFSGGYNRASYLMWVGGGSGPAV